MPIKKHSRFYQLQLNLKSPEHCYFLNIQKAHTIEYLPQMNILSNKLKAFVAMSHVMNSIKAL